MNDYSRHNTSTDGKILVETKLAKEQRRRVVVSEDGHIYIELKDGKHYVDIDISDGEFEVSENVTTDGDMEYFKTSSNVGALARNLADGGGRFYPVRNKVIEGGHVENI